MSINAMVRKGAGFSTSRFFTSNGGTKRVLIYSIQLLINGLSDSSASPMKPARHRANGKERGVARQIHRLRLRLGGAPAQH